MKTLKEIFTEAVQKDIRDELIKDIMKNKFGAIKLAKKSGMDTKTGMQYIRNLMDMMDADATLYGSKSKYFNWRQK